MKLRSAAAAAALATGLGTALAVPAVAAPSAGPSVAPSAAPSDVYEVESTADGEADGTLRSAIRAANAAGGGEIVLSPGATYRLSVSGDDDEAASGDLDVTSPITVRAHGATVDADDVDRAFHVLAGGSLTLEHLTVTGGNADAGGEVGNSGGAVLNAGTLDVTGSTLTGNEAVRAGGAVEATADSTTRITRSVLSDNETGDTPGNGGAFHLTGAGTVEITGSSIVGNTASAEGGGLWNSAAGTMTVTDTEIRDNVANGAEATQGGGGLYNDGGSLTVERAVVTGNSAAGESGSGGGLLAVTGENAGENNVAVRSSVIQHNDAARAGGAIEAAEGTTVAVEHSTLTDNTTGDNPGNGGALHITGAATVDIAGSTVVGNTATGDGGGLWNSPGGTLTVTGSTVSGNAADGEGDDNYQESPVAGGTFTVDGQVVEPVS
jgi:hypothetical protein